MLKTLPSLTSANNSKWFANFIVTQFLTHGRASSSMRSIYRTWEVDVGSPKKNQITCNS
jgi:hypothetical protein